MANSRDFTGKNRKFTGTKGIVTPKGTTGERVGSESGELRFNTTTELMEYYDGTAWKPIDAPPSISSITTSDSVGTNTVLNADGSTLYTITINGGNFGIGVNVQFIGSTGTTYTAGNITRVAASQITCKTLSSMGTTDDPYDVKVTNVSGLSIESLDAFSYNSAPVFVNATQAFTAFIGDVVTGSTINVSATDAESNTITYSIASGSLPSGLTISSSTGYITGTVGGSAGNFPFVVRASTTEGAVERQYSITTKALPSGGTITTSGDTKIHTFTSGSSSFVNPKNNLVTSYLVVAGGGGGGNVSNVCGGGGAGGMRTGSLTISNGTKTVIVGAGGAKGALGVDSTYDSITSNGGGHGGGEGSGGQSGGSGGGATYGYSGGAGTVGQGNNGGNGGQSGNIHPAGGGGGAGSAGATGVNGSAAAGAGGAGLSNSLSGSSVFYAGGAGGGAWSGSSQASAGGSGGGGNGGYHSTDGSSTAGTNGLGGGGGGGWNSGQSQSGGSGVVIITYDVTTI